MKSLPPRPRKSVGHYYVYAHLGENKKPIYIGKGTGNRAWGVEGRDYPYPTAKELIVLLRTGISEKAAYEWEALYIARYGRLNNGTGILYNKTDGGPGNNGAIRTEDQKARISEFHANREVSDLTRQRIGEAHRGKTLSEETKAKLRAARIAQGTPPITQEARDRAAEQLRGRPKSEEHKAAMRGPRGPQPNIAEAAKKRWAPRMEEMKPRVVEMLLAGKTTREIYAETRVGPNKISEWRQELDLPSRAECIAEGRRKRAEQRRTEIMPKIKALLLEGMPKKAIMKELRVGQALVYEVANSLNESIEPA